MSCGQSPIKGHPIIVSVQLRSVLEYVVLISRQLLTTDIWYRIKQRGKFYAQVPLAILYLTI